MLNAPITWNPENDSGPIHHAAAQGQKAVALAEEVAKRPFDSRTVRIMAIADELDEEGRYNQASSIRSVALERDLAIQRVASPVPASGERMVKMDNPDYAQYLHKDWVMVPDVPERMLLVTHPRWWSIEESAAWHGAIPDVLKAFEALAAAAPKVVE